MKVITAPETYELSGDETGVFLAGGITDCDNWQSEVIDVLEDHLFYSEPVIFNPRRENFPINDKSAARAQIEWEYAALERCGIFSMYFCSGRSDQPICMYELGRNILRMQMRFPSDWQDRIVISVENGYRRKQDVLIQVDLATRNAVTVNTQFFANALTNDGLIYDHAEGIARSLSVLIGEHRG